MTYSIDFSTATSEQVACAMGMRLEQIRLSQNRTQEQLATEAGVSVRTIRNLEKGESVSLDTFIRVLKSLGVQQNLEALLPDPTVRPVDRVKFKGAQRKRASSNRKTKGSKWAWGDGEDEDEY